MSKEIDFPICDRCGGTGRIHVSWDWSNGVEEKITERCPECFGKGLVGDDWDDDDVW